jgi:hypothetical protein
VLLSKVGNDDCKQVLPPSVEIQVFTASHTFPQRYIFICYADCHYAGGKSIPKTKWQLQLEELQSTDGRSARCNPHHSLSCPAKLVPVLKRGIPFNMTSEDETTIVAVRDRHVPHTAKQSGREHNASVLSLISCVSAVLKELFWKPFHSWMTT